MNNAPGTSFLRTARKTPTLAAFGVATLLTACAHTTSAPTPSADIQAPAAWNNAPLAVGTLDTESLARWWDTFNDPVLTRLVDRALINSPDVRTALARIDEARANYRVQRSTLLPSLSASASTQGASTENHRTDTTTHSESAKAGLDASWQIDLFGRQTQGLRASEADLKQTEENHRAAHVSLAAEVASAYVTLRANEADLAVVRSSLATREESLQINQWQEQAGITDSLATQQALATVASTRASIPKLEQALTLSRNQLAVLCGVMPGTLDDELASTSKVPATSVQIAVGIPAETLRQRPDVRAAEYAVAAAVARRSAAERQRFPTLSISGSLGVNALNAGKLFSPETTIASALGSLTAPIFSGGEISATIEARNAAEKQALIAYESTVLTAVSEVENALVAIQRNQERLTHLDAAVGAAQQAANLSRLRYSAGEVDFLTVLDAERQFLSSQEQQIATTSDLTSAHIQLYKALGGGWSNP